MVFVGFFVFLFVVYLLSRDDFVLIRRSISLDQLFDTIFIASLAVLLTARIVYVGLHFKTVYLNPLVFFLVPYFPGLSLSGALIGGALFVLAYLQYHKNPTARILDMFAVAFLFAFSLTEMVQAGVLLYHRAFVSGGIECGVGILALFVAIASNRFFSVSYWRDGGVSLFSLAALSSLAICWRLLSVVFAKKFVFDFEIIIFLVILAGVGVASLLRLRSAGR